MNDELKDINLPIHVGIIIDGNRRWAGKNVLSALKGHEIGYTVLKKIIKFAFKTGIKSLSIYCLSMENLKREKMEIKHLFKLLEKGLKDISNDDEVREHGVRIKVLGRTELLPERLQDAIKRIEDSTKQFNNHFLNLCIAYNGQDEIVDAVKEIINKGLASEGMTREAIKNHLYTRISPEADLIIRTGMSDGARISGFLLWDASYAEFVFRSEYWPDYTKEMFIEDLIEYNRRNRRRGK